MRYQLSGLYLKSLIPKEAFKGVTDETVNQNPKSFHS